MPLIIDGGRVPSRWVERDNSNSRIPIGHPTKSRDMITLALVNNMPDPALEDTELQFFDLLDAASRDFPVYIKLYSLTGVPRTDRGQRHLNSFYFPFEDLWENQFDGIIVTGTEPHQANLRDEPYWDLMAQLCDWAERNTSSTVLSCLAAHAAVLHCEGIKRHPLPDKKFGVFESTGNSDHPFVRCTGDVVRFPHSRWNEVREAELSSAGYTILSKSAEAGVDLFVSQRRKSLFVHFQGHPEYGTRTLLSEYRRDIKRFLRRERETFPTMPAGYFNMEAARLLNSFRETAIADRREQVVELFPESAVVSGLQNTWQSSARYVYSRWLQYMVARKIGPTSFPLMERVGRTCSGLADGETA